MKARQELICCRVVGPFSIITAQQPLLVSQESTTEIEKLATQAADLNVIGFTMTHYSAALLRTGFHLLDGDITYGSR